MRRLVCLNIIWNYEWFVYVWAVYFEGCQATGIKYAYPDCAGSRLVAVDVKDDSGEWNIDADLAIWKCIANLYYKIVISITGVCSEDAKICRL